MSADARPRRATVALLGMRCSGKTTLGHLLAAELGRPFLDLDLETVLAARRAGFRASSAGELLRQVGLAQFRELEAAALRRVLEPCPRLVLATGGGVVERADNRAWLARTARCLYLSVRPEQLVARLCADPTDRPPLAGEDAAAEVEALLERRDPLYRALAEEVIECEADPPAALVARLRAVVEETGGPNEAAR